MSWEDSKQRRICIDCGAQTLRIGLATDKQNPQCVLNAVGNTKRGGQKQLVGNKILDEYEKGNQVVLGQPMARGLLHDSDLQEIIWQDQFQKIKKFDASISSLSLTVAPVVPDIVQQRLGELVFEDLGFDALSQVCS